MPWIGMTTFRKKVCFFRRFYFIPSYPFNFIKGIRKRELIAFVDPLCHSSINFIYTHSPIIEFGDINMFISRLLWLLFRLTSSVEIVEFFSCLFSASALSSLSPLSKTRPEPFITLRNSENYYETTFVTSKKGKWV